MNGVRDAITPAAFLYALLLALGVVAAYVLKLDRDGGGYADGWRTQASFPDKAVHALSAFALTCAAIVTGVPPWLGAALTLVAGICFEYAQGYASKKDMAADAAGALGAALWWVLWRA